MGPVYRPGEPCLGRRRVEDVLLDIVEVPVGEPGLVFPERRVGLRLAVGLERSEVVLEARHERHMGKVGRWREGVEQVPQHRPVDAAVLVLGLLAGPGAEEDMADVEACETPGDTLPIQQVGRDWPDPGSILRGPARQAVDGPAFGDQEIGDVAAGDPGHADHEGVLLSHSMILVTRPRREAGRPSHSRRERRSRAARRRRRRPVRIAGARGPP